MDLFVACLVLSLLRTSEAKCRSHIVTVCDDVCDAGLRIGRLQELITHGPVLDMSCLSAIIGLKVGPLLVEHLTHDFFRTKHSQHSSQSISFLYNNSFPVAKDKEQ
jgi:hypothetical protein